LIREGSPTKAVSYRYKRREQFEEVPRRNFFRKSYENRKVYPTNNYGKIAVSGGFGLIISRQ
jgi:hypothetical protein